MPRLAEWCVPRSALSWGRLTDRKPPPWRTWLDDLIAPPIHEAFRQAAKDEEHLRRLLAAAGPYTAANRDAWRREFFLGLDTPPEAFRRPDPAAAWGEADRRAEGEQ